MVRFLAGFLLGLLVPSAWAGAWAPHPRVQCNWADVVNVTQLSEIGDGRQRSLCRVTLAILEAHQ